MKVVEFLHVVHEVANDNTDALCPHQYYKSGYEWKIASTDGVVGIPAAAYPSANSTIQSLTEHFRIADAQSATHANVGVSAGLLFEASGIEKLDFRVR